MTADQVRREGRECPPAPAGPMPWLVYRCGWGWKNQTFCTINPSSSSISSSIVQNSELKWIPELGERKIWACYHGWLLLLDQKNKSYSSLLLWNPVTLETINLPPLISNRYKPKNMATRIFTSSPKEPGCTLLLFEENEPIIIYCKPGDQQWTEHNYATKLGQLFEGEEDDVGPTFGHGLANCHNGLIYTFTNGRSHMVSIEVDNQSCINIQSVGILQPHTSMFTAFRGEYMLKSLGDLYHVSMQFPKYNPDAWETIGIEIFRLDFSEMVWVKVESLKDQVFFLGEDSATSCTAVVTDESSINGGNKVIICVDKHLYTYDLENGRISLSSPCPDLQTPWFPPAWVMPNFCSTGKEAKARLKVDGEEGKSAEYAGAEYDDDEFPFLQFDLFSENDEVPFPLPLDMLTEVADHLKLPDYLNFRAASRLFRLAASSINKYRKRPRPQHLSLESQFSYPLLVTFRHDKSFFSFMDPCNQNTYFMNIPESLQGKTLCGSKDGYLLLADGKDRLYFNPFTRNQAQLPACFSYYAGLTFSSSPSSSDFLVVDICGDPIGVEISFLCQGDTMWEYIPPDELDKDAKFDTYYNAPVVYDGSFYIFSQKGSLGFFNLNEEGAWRWEVVEKPQVPCKAYKDSYLVECDGELMSVFVGNHGKWLKVFKLDQSEMSWVRVEDLGKYVIFVSRISCVSAIVFLSRISCVSAIARIPGMENKVYLSRFSDQGNNNIVYYSLETGEFHTRGSDQALDNFFNTSEQLYCAWIECR